ncbi:hypothetical protein [Streptomyces sp. NPDC051636]|uniref:hypothetical protein n=1 Tax=Streptomyces sp. NPDC051636 TaxID=3365663 RepID=UPI0037AE0B13
MPDAYSADVDQLTHNSKDLLALLSFAQELPGQYLDLRAPYVGWAGTEGGNNDFANSVGPQEKMDTDRMLAAVKGLAQAVTAAHAALVEQISDIQKPQFDALDNINQQASVNPGNVRR